MPIIIEGRHPLSGKVELNGAKNAALPIIAATLLTSDECLLENVPFIEDIRNLVRVLHHIGVAARFEGPNRLRIKATRISDASLPEDLALKMRASFLIVGPLLARFGQALAPHPGGCSIGKRPVSVDLRGFQTMGARVDTFENAYHITAPRLSGERLVLDYPSHTGTENLIMAACLAKGTTIIENASVEPEVTDLCAFLSAMGARIYGAGTPTIRIDGVPRLHGAVFHVMPDRMEAGTFALGAIVTGGKVSMDVWVAQWLTAMNQKLRAAGAVVDIDKELYTVSAPKPLSGVNIQTYPYPGFPTDLQAPFTLAMTQAWGESTIFETMFDGRLEYVRQLRTMGANIDTPDGRMAVVHGPTQLHGAQVEALDIRSGAALVLAGLAAEGTTTINNVLFIDRGYQEIDKKLATLGADVKRVHEASHDAPVGKYSEPIEWGTVQYGSH